MVQVRIRDELVELTPEEWEERVRSGRIPPDARVRYPPLTGEAFLEARSLESYRALRNEAAIAFEGRFVGGPPPILIALLAGVQIRIFWWSLLPSVRAFLVDRCVVFAPAVLEDGQVWRLLTMGMTHTNVFHILGNGLWLAYTGWNVERAFGWRNALAIYTAAVVVGSTLSIFGSPWTPSLGASGGVFGFVAASVVFGYAHPELLQRRSAALFGFALLPYLVVMFWSGLQNEGTDNWCHLGGLLTGGLLAAFLDPEGIERRSGWNRRVRWGLVAAGVLWLLALAWAGPRLERLVDQRIARIEWVARQKGVRPKPPSDAYDWLTFEVPAAWHPGSDVARGTAFVSPMHPSAPRAFGVRAHTADHLTTPEELLAAFTSRLREEWPQAVVGEPAPAEVAGRPGLFATATLGGGDDRVVEWRGTTRGAHALEVVWQVDAGEVGRLAPLRDRLLGRVSWGDPSDLVDAREAAAHRPTPKERTALAIALARVGEADEALATAEALVAEAPDDPARWVDLVETVEVLAPALGSQDAHWDRALAAAPEPTVLVAVAAAMDAAGRLDDARGLLRIGWDRSPGDTVIKRARRRLGLSVALDASTGAPWDLAFEPVHGRPRDPAEVAFRRGVAPTVAAAREAGAELAEERAEALRAAIEAVRSGDRAGVVPLLALKDGFVAAGDTDALAALADDLEGAASGRVAEWIDPELAAAVVANPDFAELVR